MKYYDLQSIPEWIYCDTDAIYFKTKQKKGKDIMKEAKFKVGDKVIITDGSKITRFYGGWIKDMANYIGRTCTISFVTDYKELDKTYGYRMKEIDYTWDERCLKPSEDKIVISIKGKEIKVEFDDVCGKAKCNPEDDFDIKKGIMLAMERLFKKMEEIKEGDTVEVINPGLAYTTHTKWVSNNIKDKEKIAEYRYGQSVDKFASGTVLKIAKHGTNDDNLAYVQGWGGCFLIDINGLKKVETHD